MNGENLMAKGDLIEKWIEHDKRRYEEMLPKGEARIVGQNADGSFRVIAADGYHTIDVPSHRIKVIVDG